MVIYRTAKKKYSGDLKAFGFQGRWNSEGVNVIYASWSRSLACLENIVHRRNQLSNENFSLMVIQTSKEVSIDRIDLGQLDSEWSLNTPRARSICQRVGDKLVRSNRSCLIQVPSVIVKEEHNYIINTQHPDFPKIQLVGIEPFFFDPRLSS